MGRRNKKHEHMKKIASLGLDCRWQTNRKKVVKSVVERLCQTVADGLDLDDIPLPHPQQLSNTPKLTSTFDIQDYENGRQVEHPSFYTGRTDADTRSLKSTTTDTMEGVKKCSICQMDQAPVRETKRTPTRQQKSSVSKDLVMYLVQKVLEIPAAECEKYLKRYGNPSNWINLCEPCRITLNKAHDINSQILKLQSKLEEIKKILIDYMTIKTEHSKKYYIEPVSWMDASFEMRQYVYHSRNNQENEDVKMNDTFEFEYISAHDVDNNIFETNMDFTDEFINKEIIKEETEPEQLEVEDQLCLELGTQPIILSASEFDYQYSSKRKDSDNSEIEYCNDNSPINLAVELNSDKEILPSIETRHNSKLVSNEASTGLKSKTNETPNDEIVSNKSKSKPVKLDKSTITNVFEKSLRVPENVFQNESSKVTIKVETANDAVCSEEVIERMKVTATAEVGSETYGKSVQTSVQSVDNIPEIRSKSPEFEDTLVLFRTKCPRTYMKGGKESATPSTSSNASVLPEPEAHTSTTLEPIRKTKIMPNLSQMKDDSNNVIVCGDCDRIFESYDSLKKHVTEKHSDKFKCPCCKVTFPKVKTVDKHIREIHHPLSILVNSESVKEARQTIPIPLTKDGKLEIKCDRDDCKEVFSTYLSLTKHVNEVHSIGIKCTVSSCNKKFSSPDNLENHIRECHNSASISECSGCKKTYVKSKRFNTHLKENPNCKQKAVKCSNCVRLFSNQDSLDIHIQVAHITPVDLPFDCSHCDKKFWNKDALKRHTAAKHMERNLICERCGSLFTTNFRLKQHIQIVHLNREPGGERFPCKVCKREFFDKKTCREHEKLHSEESPYLCTVCGKTYKVKTQLNVHYWSHDPDRYEKYSLYKYGKGRTDVGARRKSKKAGNAKGNIDKPKKTKNHSKKVENGKQLKVRKVRTVKPKLT